MFARVEAYFAQQGSAADAAELARQSRELSRTIGQQVAAGDFDAATESASSLSSQCKTCHKAYKKPR